MGLQLGADTVRLGAFRPCQGMTNDGAVAVIQARPAVAAVRAHGPFIASGADKSGLPRRALVRHAQPSWSKRSSSMPK